MKKFLLTLTLIISSACSKGGGGGGSTAPATNTWTTYGVTNVSDLPTCTGDVVGRLYFVESSNQFQLCKSSGWTAISINGTNGATITSNKKCSKISGGALFEHKILTYSTGDKVVYCAISSSLNTYSATSFYLSSQTGATNEGCIVTYDIDTASSGFWYFTVSGSVRTAVYNDSGSASNGSTVSFLSSDCTTVP